MYLQLIVPEHPSLLQGSSGVAATSFTGSTTSQNPDGSTTIAGSVNPDGTVNEVTVSYNYCPHTDAFMADPNKDAIIAQQRAEIDARNLAAQQAAEAVAGQ